MDNEASLRLCAEIDFMYCDRPSCAGCVHNTSGRKVRQLEKVAVDLVEAPSPAPFNERPLEERREYAERIHQAVEKCKDEVVPEAITELLSVARKLGRNPLWVYWKLSKRRRTVNVPLLHEIARQKGYKPGWAPFQYQKIRGHWVASDG